MTRAKFMVTERIEVVGGGKVKMMPVTSTSDENKEFFKWTPSSLLEMGLVNPAVLEDFVPGKEFYLDFTEVPR